MDATTTHDVEGKIRELRDQGLVPDAWIVPVREHLAAFAAAKTDEERTRVRQATVDRALKEGAANGWCDEVERALDVAFGQPDGPEWSDINGRHGRWLDSQGRNRYGDTPRFYGEDGYDQDGYDRRGFDTDGYHRDTKLHRDTYRDREGFTSDGWDEDGYNREGFNTYGFNRDHVDSDGRPEFRFGPSGMDAEGRDWRGFNAAGYGRDGFNRDNRDEDGYDREGLDRRGFNREHRDAEGRYRYRFDMWGNEEPTPQPE